MSGIGYPLCQLRVHDWGWPDWGAAQEALRWVPVLGSYTGGIAAGFALRKLLSDDMQPS